MPFSAPEERQIAEKVLAALRSDKYKGKNDLFLAPFDINQVPGYLEKVGPPMDLHTISNKLQNDEYDSDAAFWNDVNAVFSKAIKYHGDRIDTKWIAKFAKDMMKAVTRERKMAAGKPKPKSSKIKVKLKTSTTTTTTNDTTTSPSSASETPKKPKIKLKLGGSGGGGASKPPPEGNKVPPKKAKPTQAKPSLKLKLSLKPKKTEAAVPPATAAKEDSSSKKTIKVVVNANNSRGKELPQGVAVQQASSSTTSSSSKPTKAKKAPVTKKSTTPKSSSNNNLPAFDQAQKVLAIKVVSGLKRRNHKTISWFLTPVSDKNILADYKSKIKNPIDLQTVSNKIEKGSYKNLVTFVLDIRRVLANALRYNTSIKDSLRPVAVQVLQSAESLLQVFVARQYPQYYTPLLYCWKICIDILDTLYNMVNPSDGQPVALYFLHPVSVYCGGKFPSDYAEKVKKPMDFGTVTANLLEGRYQTVDAFANDCRLVIQNCQTYYNGREDGHIYVEQALRLKECLSTQLDQLARYDKSNKAVADRQKAADLCNPTRLQEIVNAKKPPLALWLSILEDLRALKYTDKATKITEPAMGPFEKPVSVATYPDYLQFIKEPMDLQTVERKAKANVYYETPEDFEYDVNLIFKNCEVYNSRRNAQHAVAMAKFGARKFRTIFYAKMQAFEDPSSVPPPKPSQTKQDKPPLPSGAPPLKKIKIDASGVLSRGKAAPRISITAAQVSSATSMAARAKSPSQKKSDSQKSNGAAATAAAAADNKANQPVPLHIAIARVKEAFPLRRAVKSLQLWEADCARYFKELMRHPWMSAARPKFIFHVPVPTLFPDLREVYAAKIRKPMDLTTIECTLLAGNRYAGPEDFVQDVALVFANAIRFNRDGRDIGDPLSCAYYDASVHLLRYSRWLSLELLASHCDNSEFVNEPGADGLPPFSWRLTQGNRKFARKEIENIVMKEPLEKSLEGDTRWTWMEAECEKLLKALRHQSDLRYMSFFIQPNYPSDYSAYISKPMDWEKVQRTLKKRQYDTIGSLIEDLRLIFSNALKYNGRMKGTETVNGKAYEAAVIMSGKLEAAINKLLLSVSDRLERERIDHANAEREIEAAERAEEAEIRAAWKKGEGDKDDATPMPSRNDRLLTTRKIRRAPMRRQATDFEIPFFDEDDDGQHEQCYFELQKFQKEMFEKQRQELSKMRKVSASIGVSVFARLIERHEALREAETQPASASNQAQQDREGLIIQVHGKLNGFNNRPSAVLDELKREGRGPLQIKVVAPKAKKSTLRRVKLSGFD